MKLVQKSDDEVVFWLNPDEREALLMVVDQYPVLKEDYQSLTHSQDPRIVEAAQELLRQALAEQKAENQRFKQTFMQEGKHLKRVGRGYHLRLKGHEVERLLQVLNDVRVGLWHALGCPESMNPEVLLKRNPGHLDKYWAMEIAGSLEWHIIELLENLGY
ncbi:MAG: hypothetical protein N3J91_12575 [Verrucomicrobiae bacterium]|nr:hypothetical protein [Verrucomicrobiae bacterium]